MRFYTCLCTLFLCTVVFVVSAQERVMTLPEMYALADSNNRGIHATQLGVQAAAMEAKAAYNKLYPDISASLSLSYLGNGYCWDRNFQNGFKVDIPHLGNNLAMSVTQVLYAGGALKSQLALSRLGQQLAELQYQQKREEVRLLLSAYYLDLYKMSNFLKVYDQNIVLTQKLIDNITARQEQGTALKNDRTRYELQLEDLKLARKKVENNMSVLNYEMITALGLPETVILIPDSAFLKQEVNMLTQNQWQETASTNSLPILMAQKGVEMQNQTKKLERSAMIPQIAVVAQEHLDGPITIEVPPLNKNFNYWYIGVGIQYNFASLYKNNPKYKAACINTLRKEEEAREARDNVNTAIQSAYVHLDESFVELRTKKKTLELATQNYEVTENRYENDLALLTDMLDASNTKLSAELELVNARVNVVFSNIKLKFLCSEL